METLQSQYVYDGYEAARAITVLMYEIGSNSKVPRQRREDEESGYSSDETSKRVN
jgi:hypothetical protein